MTGLHSRSDTPPAGLRTVAEHAAAVAALIPRTEVIDVPVPQARGLVLASDLHAELDLPPFTNSAMDGYAVRVDEISAGAEMTVSQDIPAGRTDVGPLETGTVARIMTGAVLPDGADGIVPVEQTDGGVDRVRFDSGVPAGKHIRDRGSDVAAGTLVLPAGTVLAAPQIGLVAALGFATVPVYRPLRVVVLSTGSELVEPGKPLQHGQIYESNAPMLAAAFAAVGARARTAHFVADDVPQFDRALAAAVTIDSGSGDDDGAGVPEWSAGPADLIITSGGVSAGAYEVVKDALTGRDVTFAKVAMQPGMPQGCGTVEVDGRDVPIVTLPGNPVSSYVSFEVFLRPAALAAMGHRAVDRPRSLVPLSEPITSVPGKRQFRRGHLDRTAGTVAPFGGPGSHLLGWLAGADCLFVVDEDITALDASDTVEVWDLTG